MGLPNIKRRSVRMTSIANFTEYVKKFFLNATCRVLSEESDDYAGLPSTLRKLQDEVLLRMKDDANLGSEVIQGQFEITNSFYLKDSLFVSSVFPNPL